MTATLRSGKDVFDASWRAANALHLLANDDGGYIAINRFDTFDRDAERFLSTSLHVAEDEFDRVSSVVRMLSPDESTDLTDSFQTLTARLSPDHWEGDGADVFRRQLAAMKVFYHTRSTQLAAALQGLGGLIAVEAATRDSYFRLCDAIKIRADRARGGNDDSVSFIVNAVAETAKAALDADPVSLAKKGASGLIDLVSDGITQDLPQSESDEIYAAYQVHRDAIVDQHQSACGAIDGLLSRTFEEIGKIDRELIEPDKPIPDVTSPDFRWKTFAPDGDIAVPPGMVERVDRERKKYASEMRGDSSSPRTGTPSFQARLEGK